MRKLKEIINEYSKAVTIYELITVKEIIRNVDINYKYLYIGIPKEYENSINDIVPDDIIASINRELSYNGSQYSNNESIKIFYSILGNLFDRLNKIIQNKPLEYCISILSILEINRFFAQGVIAWSRQYDIKKTANKTLNAILDILNSKDPKDNFETYLFFDQYFARDKNALEIIFPYIYKKVDLQVSYATVLDVCSIDIDLMLKLANAILQITSLIDEYRRGDYKNYTLQIDGNGKIIYMSINKSQEEYFNHILQKENFYNTKYISQFDHVLESLIGLSNDTIEKISSLGNFEGLCNDEFIIDDVAGLTKRISLLGGINESNVRKLLEYMTYSCPEQYLDGKTHFEEKVTRKCFININNYLVTPLGLFKTSVVNIYCDILNRQIENDEFKRRFLKIWAAMDKEFEEFIFQKCCNSLPCIFIKHGIQQNDICVGSECLKLPGEIDVLLFYKSTLFVIECKNIGLRTTFDKINSIKRDFKLGNKKSSFQAKLKNKIDAIQANIEIVNKFMKTDIDIEQVTGCIVTSDYYFESSICSKNSYKVLVWSELINWIESF